MFVVIIAYEKAKKSGHTCGQKTLAIIFLPLLNMYVISNIRIGLSNAEKGFQYSCEEY